MSFPLSLRRLAGAALVATALTACGTKTGSDEVDTAGVNAIPSGTNAGDSANAATGSMTMPDSAHMDSAMHKDTTRKP